MEHNVQTEHATIWSIGVFATAMLYLMVGGIGILPSGLLFDIISGILAISFICAWLPFPYVLYKDRKYVTEQTDWSPSKAYYFGWLPSYLGVAVLLLYLYRRDKTFENIA